MVKIPHRIEDLVPASAVEKILDVLQQPNISGKMRDALDRVGLTEANPLEQVQQAWQQARSWIESLAADGDGSTETESINATGQLIGPEFAGIPSSASALQVYASAAAKFQHAQRLRDRMRHAVSHSFGNLSVCWLSSHYAALQMLLANRTVFIAKSDLVRISFVGNISSLLHGLPLREVGAANGCTTEDWTAALAAQGGNLAEEACILVVSPNALDATSATEQIKQASSIAKKSNVPVFGFFADAAANPQIANQLGFPLLDKQIDGGLDAVIAPLDLLLGGPSGAIAIGREPFMGSLAQRASDTGTTLSAALQSAAMIALQLNMLEEGADTGILSHLLATPDNLRERARRIAIQIDGNGIASSAKEIQRTTSLGPAPWNRYKLDNWAVEIEPLGSPDSLYERLAAGGALEEGGTLPPIAPARKDGRLLIDLRFVAPKDDHAIVACLSPAPFSPGSATSTQEKGESQPQPAPESGEPTETEEAPGEESSSH